MRVSARFTQIFLRIIVTLTLAGLGSVPLAYAASPAPQDSADTLRLAMPQPETLDPLLQSRFDPYTRDVTENLFVGLTRFNPYSGQVEPMLAKSWEVSADGLTWTFDLREDIQWVRYDAQRATVEAVRPVTAGDVVYAVQRGCDPTRPGPVTTNLMVVQGCLTVANAFPEVVNDLFIAREIGMRATGPHTLEIQLLFPTSYLPSLLSTPEFFPIPREAATGSAEWTKTPGLLTNGPYALQNWSAAGMTLVRNPHWPDPVEGTIAEVAITFTSESLTALTLAASGRTDFARLPASQIADAQSRLARPPAHRPGVYPHPGGLLLRAHPGGSDRGAPRSVCRARPPCARPTSVGRAVPARQPVHTGGDRRRPIQPRHAGCQSRGGPGQLQRGGVFRLRGGAGTAATARAGR